MHEKSALCDRQGQKEQETDLDHGQMGEHVRYSRISPIPAGLGIVSKIGLKMVKTEGHNRVTSSSIDRHGAGAWGLEDAGQGRRGTQARGTGLRTCTSGVSGTWLGQ